MIDVCESCEEPFADGEERYENTDWVGAPSGEFYHEKCAQEIWEWQQELLMS